MNASLTYFVQTLPLIDVSSDDCSVRPIANNNVQTPEALVDAFCLTDVPFSNNELTIRNNPAWQNYLGDIKSTLDHSLNVGLFALEAGRKIDDLTDLHLSYLFVAGFLHDLGKFELNPDILYKPSRLNDEEFEHIKPHADLSADIVERMNVNDLNKIIRKANADYGFDLIEFDGAHEQKHIKRIASIIRQHHELNDSTGYPLGLEGSDISLLAKIITSADVLDARTSPRPYNRVISISDALRYLENESGKLFEPKAVRALAHFFETAPRPIPAPLRPTALSQAFVYAPACKL